MYIFLGLLFSSGCSELCGWSKRGWSGLPGAVDTYNELVRAEQKRKSTPAPVGIDLETQKTLRRIKAVGAQEVLFWCGHELNFVEIDRAKKKGLISEEVSRIEKSLRGFEKKIIFFEISEAINGCLTELSNLRNEVETLKEMLKKGAEGENKTKKKTLEEKRQEVRLTLQRSMIEEKMQWLRYVRYEALDVIRLKLATEERQRHATIPAEGPAAATAPLDSSAATSGRPASPTLAGQEPNPADNDLSWINL